MGDYALEVSGARLQQPSFVPSFNVNQMPLLIRQAWKSYCRSILDDMQACADSCPSARLKVAFLCHINLIPFDGRWASHVFSLSRVVQARSFSYLIWAGIHIQLQGVAAGGR